MRRLFVAGAHTDVGKTHVACALIRAMAGRGSVGALKPVASGFDPYDWGASDPGRLIEALGQRRTSFVLEQVCHVRLEAPLAPPMAARLEGVAIDFDEIVAWCQGRIAADARDLVLVEGVGGVMSPITEDETNLDLIVALAAPSVLVGGGYLGAISHTLTAAEAMQAHGFPPVAVIVSESGEADAPDFADTVATVARFMPGTPVLAAPRNADTSWASTVLDIVRPGEET